MTDWVKLKVVDLRAELKRRGLPQNGLKGELVARLEAENEPADDEHEPAQPNEDDDEVEQHQPVEEDQQQSASDQPDEAGVESAEVVLEPVVAQPASPAANHDQADEQPVAGQEYEHTPAEEDRNATPMSAEATTTAPDDDKNPDAQSNDDHGGKVQQTAELAAGDTATDAPPDLSEHSQKRKRQSASPPPTDEAVARKRARAEHTINGEDAPAVDKVDEADLAAVNPAANPLAVAKEQISEKDGPAQNPTASDPPAMQETTTADKKDDPEEQHVAPATHPATSALYISNLMRPLRPIDIREHLAKLASTSSDSSDDLIVKFHLDQIRTHAFVIFDSVSSASRVRASLHDRVWPNESNRKPLSVDFVPPEKVNGWIELEESGGNGRPGSRWEVVYRAGPDGGVEAHLESGATANSKPGPLPNTTRPLPKLGSNSANAIPLGPRGGNRDMGPPPPTGPRASRFGAGGAGPRPPSALDHVVERTHTRPVIAYQLISEDLARRRIDNMRTFYSRNARRDPGREINRYSFEDGDKFVDRGREIFEGIRPPHRDRASERDRHGGGSRSGRSGHGGRHRRRGGQQPFRPRSDRHLPGRGSGSGSGRDDRSSRHGDDRSSSRHGNRDRDRDHRDRRY